MSSFRFQNEAHNLTWAERAVDDSFLTEEDLTCGGHFETVLVIDAEKTMTAQDTGTLFWETAPLEIVGHWHRGDANACNSVQGSAGSILPCLPSGYAAV